ncbi:hypothetical protein MSL71_24490 [Desulfoluna butyratoxydans]|uniref:Uncharacterized protein n=1 Tax=Desulfoluna butyratoxydans TaxID=231438 RepID=A0A4U8YSH9_9BACT|nr:hypothetical protein MSL71_24490 [Desulfoluna butyratoxydans]
MYCFLIDFLSIDDISGLGIEDATLASVATDRLFIHIREV